MTDLDAIYQQIGRQYVLNYAAIGSGLGKLKPKKCKKGWSCGYSCQSKDKKNCPSALTGQAKTYADWLSKQAINGVDVEHPTGYSKGSSSSGETKMTAQELPKLQGSEKQVAWAEKIRDKSVAFWDNRKNVNTEESLQSRGLLPDDRTRFTVAVEVPLMDAWLWKNVFNQTDASWWIKNKDTNFVSKARTALMDELHSKRQEWKASNA